MIPVFRGCTVLCCIMQNAMSYSQAEDDCRRKGMQLTSVMSRPEEMFLLQNIDSDPADSANIWIGFRKKGLYKLQTDLCTINIPLSTQCQQSSVKFCTFVLSKFIHSVENQGLNHF